MIEASGGVHIEVPDGEAERTFYVLPVHRLVPSEELQGKSVTIHTDDPQRAARLYFE